MAGDSVTWRTLFDTACREIEKSGGTPPAVRDIPTSRLVPLYWAPLMFCGDPGDPYRLPRDHEATGRCLEHWATVILSAIQDGEILARDQASWLPIEDEGSLSPYCLIGWQELDHWAVDSFGLSCGSYDHVSPPARSNSAETEEQKPPSTRENTLPNIIGALVALFLDTDDKGNKLSLFTSKNGIIAALLDRFSHKAGISESNLKKRFAAAEKSLDQS